jgi:hypothetical protein
LGFPWVFPDCSCRFLKQTGHGLFLTGWRVQLMSPSYPFLPETNKRSNTRPGYLRGYLSIGEESMNHIYIIIYIYNICHVSMLYQYKYTVTYKVYIYINIFIISWSCIFYHKKYVQISVSMLYLCHHFWMGKLAIFQRPRYVQTHVGDNYTPGRWKDDLFGVIWLGCYRDFIWL